MKIQSANFLKAFNTSFKTVNIFTEYLPKYLKLLMLLPVLWAAQVQGQTTLISPTGDGGFETGTTFTANGWTAVNGNLSWYFGTATLTNGSYSFARTGNRCVYISSSATANTWNGGSSSTTASTSHFYRDINFPAGNNLNTLSFRWCAGGETNYDELLVYLCPTTLTPVSGSPSSTSTSPTWTGTGTATLLGRFLLSTTTGQTNTILIPQSIIGNASASANMRLVFTWKNDGTGGTAPGIAIDDISLISTVPANISSTSSGGNWSSASTWVGGVVPNGDNVTIVNGATVTIDQNATVNNLTVGGGTSGILQYDGTTTAKSLTVNGNLTIASGATFRSNTISPTSLTGHTLNINGDFTNNGTFNGSASTNSRANITFTGATNNSFTSSATATNTFNTITINKGTSNANIFDFNPSSAVTLPAGFLTLTNGTFRVSGSQTITNTFFTSAAYTIGATTGFWLNNANATVSGQAGSPTLAGLLRISNGIYTIGTSNNSMGFSSGSSIIIEGGIVNAVARFGVASATNNVTYNQSGGTVYVNSSGGNTSTTLRSFDLGTGSSTSFTMSGGTIILSKGSANTELRGPTNASATINITGGNIQLGNNTVTTPSITATLASTTFRIEGNLPSILVNSTNNPSVSQAGATTIFGDLTLNGTGTYSNNSTALTVRGNSVSNPGNITINTGATFTINSSNTQALTFSSSFGNQTVTNNGTITSSQLPSVTINNTFSGGTVTIPTGLSLMSGSTLTLTAGTLNAGTNGTGTISLGTSTAGTFSCTRTAGALVAATATYGSGVTTKSYTYNGAITANTGAELTTTSPVIINSLTLNNASANITLDKAVSTGIFTLTNGVLNTTTSNILNITGTTAGSVTRSAGRVVGPMSRILPASLATGSTYLFPIGKAGYNPIELVNPTTTGGTVTILAEVFDANSGGSAGAIMQSLNNNRYWTASITSGSANFTNTFIRLTDASVTSSSAIATSSSLTGSYDLVGGTSPTIVAATSITSTTPAATSLPGFFAIGDKAVAMSYVSSTVTQPLTTPVLKPATNQQIIRVEIVTAGNASPLTLSSLSFNTTGSTAPGTDIAAARVWYTGTSTTFATTTQFGTDVSNPSGSYNVTGSQVLAEGTNYFWLVYDVPAGAIINNVLDAECTSIDIGSAQTPTATAPTGTRTIKAQLSGNVLIGASQTFPNYQTLTAAIADLNAFGVSGPTTLLLQNDYSSSTETFPLTINAFTGSSATNTLTIRPASGVTANISGSSTTAVIVLNGADNVIIDGSNNGTASRNLTITNTSSGISSAVVWLQSNGTNGATSNNIINCNIVGNTPTSTLMGIGSGSSTISATSLGTNNNNNTFQNNNISKVQYAIYSQGNSAGTKNTGNVITQNLINTASPNQVSKSGILVGFENNLTISNNNISNISGVSSSYAWAINLGALTSITTTAPTTGNEVTNATVSANVIGSIRAASAYGAGGIIISPATSGINLIANNIIFDVAANGTTGDCGIGIMVAGGSGSTTRVYHNSVSMSATLTGGSGPNIALAVSNNPVIDIRNNILTSTGSTGTGPNRAIALNYSTYTNLTSNYNDLFVSGGGTTAGVGATGGWAGTAQVALSNWQTTTSQDANSISSNPLFTSNTNLVPTNGTPLANAGTPLASITTDNRGATRSNTTPTIGAIEIANCAAPAQPTSLTFSAVGTGQMTINFTPVTGTGIKYLIVRYPNAAMPTNPTNGTTYALGATLGSGTVVSSGSNTSRVVSSLAPNTTYDFYVYSFNDTICLNGPTYNTISPLSGTQSTSPCPTLNPTITIGQSGADYTSMTDALLVLNGCGITQPTILELQSDYVSTGEIFPITLGNISGANSTNTITIRPAAGVASPLSITSNNATGTISHNQGSFFIIDGRPGGIGTNKMLTIENTSTTGYAVNYQNESSNNTLRYLLIESANTGTTSGTIVFSNTTGANGNDNNTVEYCDIFAVDPATATPTNAIYAAGSTGTSAANNNANIISNNNIYDFYNGNSTSVGGAGVNISAGNSNWTINNNSFYQTQSRATFGAGATFYAIFVNNTAGNGFTINNNVIGGNASGAAGGAMTINTNATLILRLINVSVGLSTKTVVNNNFIQNIACSTASASTVNSLISIQNGWIECNNNELGNNNVANSIVFNTTGTGAVFSVIFAGNGTTGQGRIDIVANTINGVSVGGTGTCQLRGISFQSSGITPNTEFIIHSNHIGNNVNIPNSINNSTNSIIYGIFGSASQTTSTNTISSNIVSGLTSTSTGSSASVYGIFPQGSTGGKYNIFGNTISRLQSSGGSIVSGIYHTAATTIDQVISSNIIRELSSSNTTASSVIGIYYSGPTSGTNEIKSNLIHSLTASSTGSTLTGIQIADAGNASIYNNMVRLGVDGSGDIITTNLIINGIHQSNSTSNHGIYFNSIFIGGNNIATGTNNTFALLSAGTTGTRIIRNNIFDNIRHNGLGAGTGKHYAIGISNFTGLTINNNDYWTGASFLARNNTTDVLSLSGWQTATSQDAGSISNDPEFVNPLGNSISIDLHINTSFSSVLESAGVNIAGITTDKDGDIRPGPLGSTNGGGISSDIGADEFDGTPGYTCSTFPALTATTTNATVCNSTAALLQITGTITGTGITYQWQSATTQNGTYSNISGATGATYTVPSTSVSNLWYVCQVTCANGPTTATTSSVNVQVQACNYTVTRNTGITYNSIMSTGTTYTSLSSADDGFTNLVSLTGTTFRYRGSPVSGFVATTNGWMTFNTTNTSAQHTNNLGSSDFNVLAPFWDDLVIRGNSNTTANRDACMRYQVIGTLGSGTADIVIEWAEMERFNYGDPNVNFQVVLHEADNSIDFNYGNFQMFNGATNPLTQTWTYSVGMNGPTPATASTDQRIILQAENSTFFNATSQNSLGYSLQCNSQYRFVPSTSFNAGSAPTSGSFFGSTFAPANNEVAGAIGVAVNNAPCTNNCGNIYTSKNATATSNITACSATTSGNADDDVFFSFTTTTATNYRIAVDPSAGYDAVVQLLDASLTPVICVNGAGPGLSELIASVALNTSSVYYLRIYDAAAGTSNNGEFAICVSEVIPPPANDDPSGAVVLTAGTTCTGTSSTLPATLSATATSGITACTAGTPGTPDDDIWYSFTTNSIAGTTYSISATGVSTYNAVLQLFSGTVGNLTSVNCVNATGNGGTETINAGTLATNTTYYFRVYHSGTGAANGNVSVCVVHTLPTCLTSISATTGDYIWQGQSINFNTANNWLIYNGPSSYSVATAAPSSANIFIPSSTCFANQPTISSAPASVNNVSILSGATLDLGNNTLTVNGNLSSSGTLTTGTSTVILNGSSAQSITAGQAFYNLTIDNNSGVSLGQNITVTNNLTLTAGTLTVGARTLSISGSITRTAGNIDASNTSATVTFNGSATQSIPASTFTGNINNLTVNNSAGLSTSQNLSVTNTLTLTSGNLSLGSSTLTLNGAYPSANVNNITTTSSSSLVLNCTGTGPFTLPNFTTLNALTINSSGQSYALNSSPTLSGNLTLSSGTLTVGANTLTLNGSISRTSGNINASHASATVVFSGSSAQSIPASTFTGNVNNLTLNNSAGLSTSQSLTVANTLTLTSGNLSLGNSTLTLNGAYPSANVNNITTTSSSSLVLNCTGTGPFTLPNFTALNALTINSSGQSYALNSSPTLSGNLTLTSGTLTVGANTLTLNGSISRTSGNINASHASATVVFGGSSAQTIADASFTGNVNNLTVNNSSGVTCNQALTVVGTLNLQSGAISNSTNTLTVSGNVSRTSGFVNGNLLKTVANGNNLFEVGGSVYAPVTLNFTGISGTVQITSRAVEGTPTTGSGITSGCNHYWTIDKSGTGTFTRYNATFDLVNTSNNGNTGNYMARVRTNSTWSNADFSNSGNTFTTIFNTVNNAEFAFGELSTGYSVINISAGTNPVAFDFGNIVSGTSSTSQVFQVSGVGLNTNSNMEITAPSGYEISLDGLSFSPNLQFTNPTNIAPPKDIYVRYSPTSANGSNNTVINITSDGAATKNIELTGIAIATEPTTAPTLSFGTRTATSVVLNFTGGNGSKRVVIARETSATNFTPTDATDYTALANSDFSAAADQGSGNKIVYTGSGSSVTITGLTTNSTYHFTVFEYNEGTSNSQNYLGTGNTGNITLSSALFASGTGATDLTQDFSGLANTGTSSTLPSGWYVSESGFNANSTYTANNGSNNLGDIYSFGSTSAADRAIGTLRDDNLAPTIGTQLVNNTGETITSIAIQYTGEQWRLGATGRADRLDFQYSTDATSLTTGTWTDVNSLDFSSPITTGTVGELDGNASNNRTLIRGNITGINLTANATLWIRWADADIAGAEDGLAIDDVIITPFSNTRLTGNTDVNAGSYTNLNIVNDATLQGNATITGQIRFQTGTKINLNGNTLTLSGVISGSPTFVGGTTSALIINGSGNAENINFDQTTPGTTNRLQNFTLNRASTTITLGNEMQVTGTVTPDAGTLDANGNLVLVSTSESNTGRIAQIQSGADVIGNVTVQRFMQGGVIARRGWRTMSSPTAGFTYNQLVDDILITGPGGAANGFDNSTSTSSILTYQENTTGGRGWKNITNTSNSLSEGHGMLVFFRGDRGQTSSLTNTSTVPNNTVMDYFGNINKGFIGPVNLSYTNTGVVANDGWNLLGNPYPCEINYGNIGKVGNVSTGYWVWNTATGNYESKLSSDNIAIGQGFFVQTTSGGSALSFAEDDKTNTSPTAYFKTQVIPFAVKMYQDSTRYDIAWLHNEIGAVKNYVFNEDAMKLLNSNINMGFVTTDNQLVQRNVVGQFGVNTADTFIIRTNAATNGTYTLKFEEINQIPANKQVFLLDLFNNNLSNIRNNAYYSFTINNSNNATRGDRFRLIITDLQNPLPVKLVEFKGKRHNQNDKLVWTTAEEKNMLGYEIQQSTDGEHFEAIGLVKATNLSGMQTYTFVNPNVNGKVYYRLNLLEFNKNETSRVVVLDDEALTTELSIYPNPANNLVNINIPSEKAIAELKIMDAAGRVLFEQKQVEHSIGVDVSTWPKGVYFIQATELPTQKLVIHHE